MLDLNCAGLKEVPGEVSSLSELKKLILRHNKLTILPVGLTALKELEVLWVDGNGVALPDFLGQLTRLKSLRAENCALKTLPANLGKLDKLQYLGLGNNQLSQFPSCVAELDGLIVLLLPDNQLPDIPDTLAKLSHLKILDIRRNRLKSIPKALYEMPALTNIKLGGHEFSEAEIQALQKANPNLKIDQENRPDV